MRLLIIDDDPGVIDVLERGLAGCGYEVATARSGEDGVALAAARSPDLVITDLVMPGIDGFEVTRRIKRGRDEFLPVMLLTAHDQVDRRVDGFAAGCDDYLAKPVNLHELRARVHSLLERRAQDIALRTAHAGLRDAGRLKEELAALVVHDLRNPLSALRGNLDFIEEYFVAAPATVRESLSDCRALVIRALGLVGGLLDVAQLEEGLLHAVPAEVPLAEFLTASIKPLQRDAVSRRLRVEITVEPPSLRARVDPGLLGRVVENLFDNALRYAPLAGRVLVDARLDGGKLVIVVGNDGPPVAASDRERIFDKYYRIEARRAGARANRGLGLYFCKLAALAHDGRIAVEERPSWPACFVLRLPQPG